MAIGQQAHPDGQRRDEGCPDSERLLDGRDEGPEAQRAFRAYGGIDGGWPAGADPGREIVR